MANHKGKSEENTSQLREVARIMENVELIDDSIAKHPIPPATSTDENPAGELKKPR